jgi:hypothetical protein
MSERESRLLRSNAGNGIPLVAANAIKKTVRKRSNTPVSHVSLVTQAQSNINSNLVNDEPTITSLNINNTERSRSKTPANSPANISQSNEIPRVAANAINKSTRGRSKTPVANVSLAIASTSQTPNDATKKIRKQRTPKEPKEANKIQCVSLKINGSDVNPSPLLANVIGSYVHYPVGKLIGFDLANVIKVKSNNF